MQTVNEKIESLVQTINSLKPELLFLLQGHGVETGLDTHVQLAMKAKLALDQAVINLHAMKRENDCGAV